MLFCVPILHFARVSPVLFYRGAGRFMPLLNNGSYDLSLPVSRFTILLHAIFNQGSEYFRNGHSNCFGIAISILLLTIKSAKEG
jgi:hypothetical protein